MWCTMGMGFVFLFVFFGMQSMDRFQQVITPEIVVTPDLVREWRTLHAGRYVHPITGDDEDTRMRYPTVTKSLIVRSVYFDPRPRVPGHDNASVFLVAGSKEILSGGLIVKCQLGPSLTSALDVRILEEDSLTHKEALVDCYDMPIEETGLRAFLYYKESLEQDQLYTAESEKQFEVITSRGLYSSMSCNGTVCNDPLSTLPPTVVACVATLHYGNPPPTYYWLFYKWLDHLESIGVDHVHIITEHSFLAREGFANQYIFDAVHKKYLSVMFWQSFLNDSDVKNHSQVLAYNDCLYRHLGIYDYILLVDWNYFFVPQLDAILDKPPLASCASKCGCRFDTRHGTAGCSDREGVVNVVRAGKQLEGEGEGAAPGFLHRIEDMKSVGRQREGEAWTAHDLKHSTRAVFKKLECS